jgi:hypothetical protein
MDADLIVSGGKVLRDEGFEGLTRNEFGVNTGNRSGEPPNVQSAGSALIDNLLWIKADPRARVWEEYLEKAISLFEPRVDWKSRQIRKVRDEVLRLVSFFLLFQVVLLLCAVQSNVLQCRNLWTPFSLSALASIITLGGVIAKCRAIESLEDSLHSEEESLQVAVKRIYELRREGPKYNFSDRGNDFLETRSRRVVTDNLVLLPLVSSSVIILTSFWHIMCKS